MNKLRLTIEYETADGEKVPLDDNPAVERYLRKEEKRERTHQRDDRRFLDDNGYIEGETELFLQDLDESVVERVEYRQRKRMVKDAINALPPRQRKLICDYYFKSFTMQDIADREHITKPMVHRILKNARQNLKRIIIRNSKYYGLHQDFSK